MSLDGSGKMSKSENQMSTLYLEDDDDIILKKIMKAKTDIGPVKLHSTKPDYIENLFTLMTLVSAPAVVAKFEEDYSNCSIRYGDMKKQLAEDMVNFIAPIRQKTEEIRNNEVYLKQVMEQGAAKARKTAAVTMKLVKERMGLDY